MSKKQLAKRAISGKASVGLNRLRDGTLTNREIDGLCAAFTALADAKIQIDDRAGLTDAQIKAKLRRWKAEYDIQAAFIDYLQLIRPSRSRKSGNREEDVSGISQSMKEIAKELGISIVVLAQLNRNPEGRNGGRPRISDLRESGSIEQDADIIGLFHRPDYYAESEEQRQELEGRAELIIGKNRNGPVGEVPLTFLKSCTKFVSRAKEFNQ
jgi:replicative DNA helicase